MEATVPSRIALSAASLLPRRHAVAGDRSSVYRGRYQSSPISMSGKGGGVLDRPIEKVSPGRQSESDVKKKTQNDTSIPRHPAQ
uniref:ATP-dependent Clp protease adaptor protein ClpS containing protein n=1 Tax=Arundo donax TaxID=35708 RepID=A0A0A8ZW42_ARUDO